MEEANTLLLKLLMQKSMNGKIEFGRYYMNNPIGIILSENGIHILVYLKINLPIFSFKYKRPIILMQII